MTCGCQWFTWVGRGLFARMFWCSMEDQLEMLYHSFLESFVLYYASSYFEKLLKLLFSFCSKLFGISVPFSIAVARVNIIPNIKLWLHYNCCSIIIIILTFVYIQFAWQCVVHISPENQKVQDLEYYIRYNLVSWVWIRRTQNRKTRWRV